MKIKEVLKKYHKIEIELLLAHVLKKPKEFLYLNPKYKLSSYQVKSLSSLVARRLKGEPMAYILGYKDFYGLRFEVNRDVLIPRPETEWLVERIMNYELRIKNKKPKCLLDLGTGSGNIIVSLAKESGLRHDFYASDISQSALAIARQNAKLYKVKIKFYLSDMFKRIPGKFDIIVANLPYVPRKYYVSSIKYLGWEPKIALVDPKKDFDIYRRFFQQVGGHLAPNGRIYLEIDPKVKPLIAKWSKKHLPQAKVLFYKNFNNLWRYAVVSGKGLPVALTRRVAPG